jgi:MoxR-like ATPase
MPTPAQFGVEPVATLDDLVAMRAAIEQVRLSADIVAYIVDIVRATREHPALQFGASPRAANMLASAGRALAALGGRDYVIPDDVKLLAPPTLRHRLVLAPGAEIEGADADKIVAQILEQVPAPR